MKKPLLPLALGSALLFGASFSSTALAQQNPNCPPGSWFCANAQGQTAAPAGQPVNPQLQQLPPPAAAPPPAPPPAVVYQAPPPVVVVPARPDQPPPVYVYTPREPVPRKNEWGLTARIEGAMFGSRAGTSSGMGGAGIGLKFRPIPQLGLEGDLDFLGGHDYNGFRRNETAFSLNGLLYANPRSPAQIYFLAGFGWSGAHVEDTTSAAYYRTFNYGYFGGQAGVGLEWRLARHFALNFDLRGFIRGRIDDNAHYRPEFVDPATGRTTNTSGGGLLTGGLTFYF